jgi:hypothetical protein
MQSTKERSAMEQEQLNDEARKFYKNKYGRLLQQVAEIFAETAGSGDALGTLYLFNELDKIVALTNALLTEYHRRSGEC